MFIKEIMQYSKELNVLFVEDDFSFQEETAQLLKEYFKEVFIASDGVEALKLYYQKNEEERDFFDIVITDINMPKKDGIEMAEEICNFNKNQKILVISAHNESTKLMKLIEIGISSFIIKPIKMKQFQDTILNISKAIYTEKSKKDFLIAQSKQTAMGEMIDIIAHQWLSQITIAKLRTDSIKYEIEENIYEEVKNYLQKQQNTFVHLEQTVREFRRFFINENKPYRTNLKEIISKTLVLVHDLSIKNNVTIENLVNFDLYVNVIPNQIKHVFLNLIQNSIQAFEDNKLNNRKVTLKCEETQKKVKLIYLDNAGGINDNIIHKIFEAKITSKSYGTGMGLYLCKIILNKISAQISAFNTEEGACFEIVLKSLNLEEKRLEI